MLTSWSLKKIGISLDRRTTITLSILITALGGIILFNEFKAVMIKRYFAKYANNAVTISSIHAQQREWTSQFHTVGNLTAIKGVNVNAQAAGNVVAIHFESGQYAEQGTLLIDIDDSVEQATLKYNQADLNLQQLNYQRQADLFKRAATSGSSVDEAKARLLEAEANVEKTQALIRQKHIIAPFSGQIGLRQINLGEYITPGQTTIAPLQMLDPLYMSVSLPEQLITKLNIGQNITFTVEQNRRLVFEGKITAINAKVDEHTHMIDIQATVPNCPLSAMQDPLHSPLVTTRPLPSGKILVQCDTARNQEEHISRFNFIPGMFAAVRIEQEQKKQVVTVPSTAISYGLYGNSVFMITQLTPKEKDSSGREIYQVKQVFVTTGDEDGNETIIKHGLAANDMVVSSGELKLQNGTRVVINNDVPLPTTDINRLGQ